MIVSVRDQQVILDADLARVYGVPTKALNQAVKRNRERFPDDFMFELTANEVDELNRSQIVAGSLRSQFVTSRTSRGGRRYLPYAFTEHGALMAATVLSSPQAVKMNLFIIRAFIKPRAEQTANAAILKRLAEIDRTLLQHDAALRDIYQELRPLLAPPPDPPKREIGFHIREKAVPYRVRRRATARP